MEPFEWTQGATDAAQMVADDDLSYVAIATAVGTSHVTLRSWRAHPGGVVGERGAYRCSSRFW